ncbi:S1C family serine protease [Paenibacillus shunpengii]|uniref:S1C family serine protease n=1 Tax=Paenibacillus shunpengii TaxID=2054424 RepID=A0ABW5SK72_9BACL|nr:MULTISPECIES: trypsin-like peptidase domain-containing protein [unclassified Paenibacillus]OMC71554.1 serine protease [Paenibacillus sp. FSL H7-0326]SDW27971.1 serine protease, S1-C subfamily, contains C-terminal PDZ domain [Paenibacillus sp. PDC88]
MSDNNNNNRFGREDDEREQSFNESRKSENSGSYYYSYGPFQSMNTDKENHAPEANDVEVTPPEPVKPIPTMVERSSSNFTRSGGSFNRSDSEAQASGGGSGDQRNWNYNHKPKTRSNFKTGVFSFIAGMLVIAVLMFTSDRMNLFTPEAALSNNTTSAGETASSEPVTSSGSGVTTSLPVGSQDISGVVSKVSPAVVEIETFSNSASSNSRQSPYYNDPLYQYFFGGNGGGSSSNNGNGNGNGNGSNGQSSSQLTPLGVGSGFIFEKDGYILTNEHVVSGADVIQVTLEDNNKPYEAKLLGSSPELDLAVLKIEGDDFPVAAMGNSDDVQVGEWLVAIGNPGGFEHTVTAGVLSAKDRTITINDETTGAANEYNNLLQTDASINPGNSGGPLLNLQGEVIGMNVAVSADAQGIGFAIPSSVILNVVDKLKNNEEIPKEPEPFIGASLMDLTPEVAKQMGTDLTEGSVVMNLVYQSPAYTADLRPYDIITGINGKNYATTTDLIEQIQTHKVGDEITLNVNRDGNKMDVKVTIGDRNDFDTTDTQNSQNVAP